MSMHRFHLKKGQSHPSHHYTPLTKPPPQCYLCQCHHFDYNFCQDTTTLSTAASFLYQCHCFNNTKHHQVKNITTSLPSPLPDPCYQPLTPPFVNIIIFITIIMLLLSLHHALTLELLWLSSNINTTIIIAQTALPTHKTVVEVVDNTQNQTQLFANKWFLRNYLSYFYHFINFKTNNKFFIQMLLSKEK